MTPMQKMQYGDMTRQNPGMMNSPIMKAMMQQKGMPFAMNQMYGMTQANGRANDMAAARQGGNWLPADLFGSGQTTPGYNPTQQPAMPAKPQAWGDKWGFPNGFTSDPVPNAPASAPPVMPKAWGGSLNNLPGRSPILSAMGQQSTNPRPFSQQDPLSWGTAAPKPSQFSPYDIFNSFTGTPKL